MEQMEKSVARKSAQIYLPISLGAASLFFLIASLVGGYPSIARLGGMVWVALLTLIISMPVVTSRVKKGMRD
jgi:cation transport ATPase